MDAFATLEATIRDRMTADPKTSYIAELVGKGRRRIAQKLGEEAVETVIASIAGDRAALVDEAADLIFHLAILLHHAGLSFDDVRTELMLREGRSGLAEKAARTP